LYVPGLSRKLQTDALPGRLLPDTRSEKRRKSAIDTEVQSSSLTDPRGAPANSRQTGAIQYGENRYAGWPGGHVWLTDTSSNSLMFDTFFQSLINHIE